MCSALLGKYPKSSPKNKLWKGWFFSKNFVCVSVKGCSSMVECWPNLSRTLDSIPATNKQWEWKGKVWLAYGICWTNSEASDILATTESILTSLSTAPYHKLFRHWHQTLLFHVSNFLAVCPGTDSCASSLTSVASLLLSLLLHSPKLYSSVLLALWQW